MRNNVDGVNHGKKSKERNVATIRLVQGMQDNDHDPYIAGNLSTFQLKHVINNLIVFEFGYRLRIIFACIRKVSEQYLWTII